MRHWVVVITITRTAEDKAKNRNVRKDRKRKVEASHEKLELNAAVVEQPQPTPPYRTPRQSSN
jgi:hypothetical protein